MKVLSINVRMGLRCILSLILICSSGCRKFLEIDPPIENSSPEQVYGSTAAAANAMTGIYAMFNSTEFRDSYIGASDGDISLLGAIFSDELDPTRGVFFFPALAQNEYVLEMPSIWNFTYRRLLYRVNAIIEGVTSSKLIPQQSKDVLLGEAKFMRAFAYFYLVNFYGDVPLVISTDFKQNSNVPRSPKNIIYDQIVKDLLEAEQGLTENYLNIDLRTTSQFRVRPNRLTAKALLARVYLYTGQWNLAEAKSTEVINNVGTFDLVPLEEVFSKESKEAIWQLQSNPIDPNGTNVRFARLFFDGPNRSKLKISGDLINAFEQEDQRRNLWTFVNTDYNDIVPAKYKMGADYSGTPQEQMEFTMVLRLAEQYLIRAEARGRLSNFDGAEADVNKLRHRAGLTDVSFSDNQGMLDAIVQERRVELFTEWGNRWFDLKRLNLLDAVMKDVLPKKVSEFAPLVQTWAGYKALLPIPFDEFKYNPALIGHQNPGYPER